MTSNTGKRVRRCADGIILMIRYPDIQAATLRLQWTRDGKAAAVAFREVAASNGSAVLHRERPYQTRQYTGKRCPDAMRSSNQCLPAKAERPTPSIRFLRAARV